MYSHIIQITKEDCTLYGESFINDVTFLRDKKYCNLSTLGFLHQSVTWRWQEWLKICVTSLKDYPLITAEKLLLPLGEAPRSEPSFDVLTFALKCWGVGESDVDGDRTSSSGVTGRRSCSPWWRSADLTWTWRQNVALSFPIFQKTIKQCYNNKTV